MHNHTTDPVQVRLHTIYRVTLVGLVVNLVLAIGKLAAGIWGRSGAMVADAVHSFSDLVTDFVLIIFARLSAKPTDHDHQFGHGKYETLATVLISLMLAAVGFGILYEGVQTIVAASRGAVLPRPTNIALVAAFVSIVVKEILYQYTVRAGRRLDSPSVVANAWHHRSDAISSMGTLTGIGCAFFLGDAWRIADPIAAVVVSFFVLRVAYQLIRTGVGELMERSLPVEDTQAILDIINALPEVQDPHNLRTRRIGSTVAIDVHIRVAAEMTVGHSHEMTVEIERRLREHFGDNSIITIHVEPVKKS